MKCNKCLKIIPKGEEIRFQTREGLYGCGNYCEDCWKKTKFYNRYYKNDWIFVKEEQAKQNSSSNFHFDSFVGGIFVMFVLAIVFWLIKNNNKND